MINKKARLAKLIRRVYEKVAICVTLWVSYWLISYLIRNAVFGFHMIVSIILILFTTWVLVKRRVKLLNDMQYRRKVFKGANNWDGHKTNNDADIYMEVRHRQFVGLIYYFLGFSAMVIFWFIIYNLAKSYSVLGLIILLFIIIPIIILMRITAPYLKLDGIKKPENMSAIILTIIYTIVIFVAIAISIAK